MAASFVKRAREQSVIKKCTLAAKIVFSIDTCDISKFTVRNKDFLVS